MKTRYAFNTQLIIVLCMVAFVRLARAEAPDTAFQWEPLLDPGLSKWDIFMGVPHTSVQLDGYEKSDDVTKGTPIGLNKDPKKVFTTRQENGETILVVSGEIYAGLVTKKEYENYHLSAQFKWGEKKWEPRLDARRNSGVLYHSVGKNTDFWNVWMTCIECEVMEHDCGDLITLGNVRAKVPAFGSDKKYQYRPGEDLVMFSWAKDYPTGRCIKASDAEMPNGEWNTMEIITLGNKSLQIVNGKVCMLVVDPEVNVDGQWVPMNKGKIQLQSEAATLYYKDIRIRPIIKFPDAYAKHVDAYTAPHQPEKNTTSP